MRAVVQRVSSASVSVDQKVVGRIASGLVVLLGVAEGDTDRDAQYLADKVVGLRIFEDDDGKMNRSLMEMGGELLAISQFTLLGDCRKGRRPSFIAAARPEQANALYETFIGIVATHGVHIECGRFQAHMMVELINDGPVTILLDSRQ